MCGAGSRVVDVAAAMADRLSTPSLSVEGLGPPVRSHRLPMATPDEDVAARHHLVVTVADVGVAARADVNDIDGPGSTTGLPWTDVVVGSETEAERLVAERLAPWADRWRRDRRAPRAQTAVVADHDPSWYHDARRLIARVAHHTQGLPVRRIDHIGSTSVPGLPAKNLIDLQVTVPDDEDAPAVATAIANGGFVVVKGEWFGRDRDGRRHPEQVCVDADPGRPVNINIRSATRPVVRDTLLFRDWLRADVDACRRYLAVKRTLEGRPVDDYGDGKEPFIAAALSEAEVWAERTGWTFAP